MGLKILKKKSFEYRKIIHLLSINNQLYVCDTKIKLIIYGGSIAKDAHEPVFIQAVQEVAEAIIPFIEIILSTNPQIC